MTPRKFLSLAVKNTKKSAEAFLASYRSFLETGELAEKVSPILLQMNAGDILPTPGFEAIKNVTLAHIIAQDASRAEASLEESQNHSTKSSKPYVAVIMTAEGVVATVLDDKKEEKALRAHFDHIQEAERWCQRRLNENVDDWHGEVSWLKCLTKAGVPMVTKITRAEAVYALREVHKSPFMHYNKSGGSLSKQKMKVKAKHTSFSQG